MKREIADKFKETAAAVLPVAGVILLLHFTVAPMPSGILALFLSSTVFLIFGMAVFTLGADIGMTPMGNQIGNKLVEKKSLALFILTSLILGILITIAEPDLQVPEYLAVGFDSGGVTTGPITVPFILALGVGIASVRGGESSQNDSFGLVGLCSVGPILTVLHMSLFIYREAV